MTPTGILDRPIIKADNAPEQEGMIIWLSVDDEEPEPYERVLVWVEDMPRFPRTWNNVDIGYLHAEGSLGSVLGHKWHLNGGQGSTVTHWARFSTPRELIELQES
jgi:hypothetical protein